VLKVTFQEKNVSTHCASSRESGAMLRRGLKMSKRTKKITDTLIQTFIPRKKSNNSHRPIN